MLRNIKRGEGSKSGVYKITNLLNYNFYIGCTKHLSSRYRSHLYTLKNNKSDCIILQNAVNKYGIENFEFSVIEVTELYKEKEIQLLNTLLPKYNCILETFTKRELSEETRKKMSLSQKERYKKIPAKKGYKKPNFKRNKKNKVKSIDPNNNEIIHNSIKEAKDYFNFCTLTAIYQCCLKTRNNVKGIRFEYYLF